MGFMCKISGHKWNGCKCERCGETRDEQHDWDLCNGKCAKCGKTCPVQHDWKGCKCVRCGIARDREHEFEKVPGECVERCVRCGKEKQGHTFTKVQIEPDKQYCYMDVCAECGKEEMRNHSYSSASQGIGKALLTCRYCGHQTIEPHEHRFWSNQCDYCGVYENGVVKKGDFYTIKTKYGAKLVGYSGGEHSKIVIPEGITHIGMGHLGSFDKKEAIVEVVFPASLKRTGMHVFCYCKNLKKVTFNEGLMEIGQGAFGGCSSLSEVYIPPTVMSIEYSAFSGCKELTIVCHEDSAAHRFAEKEKFHFKLLPKDENMKVAASITEKKIFVNEQENGVIRHIVCICNDLPDINQRKPKIQSYIIDNETNKGSTLNQLSRISFDSFIDNSHLHNDNSLKMKLMEIYGQTYSFSEAESLALKSVYRGEMKQDDGDSILAKFFVLYA